MIELLLIGVMVVALILAGPTIYKDYQKRVNHHAKPA